MDRRRADNARQTAEEMTNTVQKSYQTIAENAIAAQERNVQFFQNFFETWNQSLFQTWNETLKGQIETNHAMVQSLSQQAQRLQESYQALVQGSVSAYMGWLNSMFSYSQARPNIAKWMTEK